MRTITSLICVIVVIGAVATNGASKSGEGLATPRPRPTHAPRPTPPLTADIGSSYSNSKVPYSLDGPAILTALGYPGQDPAGIAYGDFNGDGIPDVVFAPPYAIVIALGQPGGGYIDGTTQVISGELPAPNGRKILVAD